MMWSSVFFSSFTIISLSKGDMVVGHVSSPRCVHAPIVWVFVYDVEHHVLSSITILA